MRPAINETKGQNSSNNNTRKNIEKIQSFNEGDHQIAAQEKIKHKPTNVGKIAFE